MEIPAEFFTVQSMLTLTGTTTATYVISNVIQHVFNYNPKWLALIIAMALSFFGVFSNNGTGGDYFIGIINGFLIYATSLGIVTLTNGNAAGAQATARGAGAPDNAPPKRRTFLSPWY